MDWALSPVHTSNNVEATLSNATMSNVASTLLPFLATMSKQRSTLLPKRQQCRTSFALKFRPFDKVERRFDIVAGVDAALDVVDVRGLSASDDITPVSSACHSLSGCPQRRIKCQTSRCNELQCRE